MSGWLDGWTRVDNPRTGGGTYDPDGEGYPYRIVLHTIEGRNMPNTAGHQYPPQLWYHPATQQKIQTIPLDRAGFALWQGSDAPYYTNRARAIQVELVGYAEEAGGWPDSHLVNIAQDVIVPIVEWVQSQGGTINLSDPAVPLAGAIPNSAREDAPQRLEPHVWAFGPIGLCGHRHVPMGDDHWDTGALDLRKIAAYARELLGTSGPATIPGPTNQELFTVGQYEQIMGYLQAQEAARNQQHSDVAGAFAELRAGRAAQTGQVMGYLQAQEATRNTQHSDVAAAFGLVTGDLDVIQGGVNDTYQNLTGQITSLSAKLGSLADAIVAAVAEKLEAPEAVIAPVDLDALRLIVREELAGLVFRSAA